VLGARRRLGDLAFNVPGTRNFLGQLGRNVLGGRLHLGHLASGAGRSTFHALNAAWTEFSEGRKIIRNRAEARPESSFNGN
jgi:hypothetical protein